MSPEFGSYSGDFWGIFRAATVHRNILKKILSFLGAFLSGFEKTWKFCALFGSFLDYSIPIVAFLGVFEQV